MQSLHRVRSRLVGMRTMLMNQLRAILLERGLVFPQGRRKFETAVGILVTDPEAQIGARIRSLVVEIREEWANLDRRIEALDRDFVARARADEAARRLVSIPGVGPMTATALRAAVDDGSAFASARDLPAWLGLVPRQHRPAASRSCSGSVSGATLICVGSSSTARAQRWPHCPRSRTRPGDGCAVCWRGRTTTSWSSRSPPSSRRSHGRRCAEE